MLLMLYSAVTIIRIAATASTVANSAVVRPLVATCRFLFLFHLLICYVRSYIFGGVSPVPGISAELQTH